MLSNGGPGAGGFQPLEDGDPRIVGGYRLVARLGSGGMGRVYLSHTPGGRAVAVKVIRPELAENAEFRKRFQAEVASASRVHGLYTAPVVDSDTEGSVPWCATAYVPGPSLADAIRDHGPLPVDTVLRLIAGVAEALQAVHREGIVHRDLKPSNVLLADDGPRVIDFGVARAADATSVTQSGMALGTVAYMAPEQALGGEAAPSADVFALGQTAVFASTGRGAFGDDDAHAVLYRVVHEQPDLGHVPDEIRELVARCLRKPAAERPSVEEVIRSVQTIQAHRGDEARYTSGAWLPGELAAGIAARAEGAHQAQAQAQAEPEQAPGAHGSGGFGTAGSGGFGAASSGGFGAAGSGDFGAAGTFGPVGSVGFGPAAAYSPTSPSHSAQPHPAQSHAALPGPFVMGNPAEPGAYTPPPWPQEPAAAQTSPVTTEGAGRRARPWLLSAAAVVLVAGGAAAALLLVPGDGDKDDSRASEVAASQSAPKAEKAPSASGSPSAKASKKPKSTKSALPSGPSGPATPTQAPNPAAPAASSEPAAPKAPAPVTYSGIRMTASHDLYLADTPVRSKADSGSSDEDLTYAVYSSGAVLAPGTTSGSSLALLPSGRQGSVEACKAATGYKSYIWIKDLTVGQQMCVISGTGHVGLVTYRGSSGTTYATLDVKVWRDAV
ncbi:serine/threonine-protein kinase [Streptomyces phaeochromogenes]|uniref:serine/threonine-protein kinase n=1 Tax=Streptomyces phaeochromogenes TaxID=1923 RepID=UPI002E120ECA|nr:protein kinase [Streptomyces phaeochromogenes]WSJ10549.1 protein kinase [Streptomyces phaeochromogenes]